MNIQARRRRPRNAQRVRRRDIEKSYPRKQSAAKLRRLAGAVERSEPFAIRVAGNHYASRPARS